MAFVLDTNVAIHLRDGDPVVALRVGRLNGAVLLSMVTRGELVGGVYRDPIDAPLRRVRLDAVLSAIPTLAFDEDAADAYRTIVERVGYSRRKLLDHMVAAQALEAARLGITSLEDCRVPWHRPQDYYAEMVKSDDHMLKVKEQLMFEQKNIEETAQR